MNIHTAISADTKAGSTVITSTISMTVTGTPSTTATTTNTSDDGADKLTGSEPTDQEAPQGYAVDLACLRKYPHAELVDRARQHTIECAVMGHRVESGYALVDEEGELFLLDPDATPHVLADLNRTQLQQGVALRGQREMHNGEMKTLGWNSSNRSRAPD